MIERILGIIESVWYHGTDFFGNSFMFWVFLVSLLVLFLVRKRNRWARVLFWFSMIVLILITFPVTAKMIQKAIGNTVYWRTFWLLPIPIVIAFAVTYLLKEQKNTARQWVIGACCFGIIAVSGKFVFGDTYFQQRENDYKIPQEVILVADAINQHVEEHNIVRKRIVAPFNIATYIRYYDPTFRQHYGRGMMQYIPAQTELYRQINSEEPDFDIIAERARKAKMRYVILWHSVQGIEPMKSFNYDLIYSDDRFDVFFYLGYGK